MHEMVIVEGILEAVLPEVEKYHVNKVLSIKLKIGELSGVVPYCIEEYFRIAARGTLAEGAAIKIEKIPVQITCRDCGFQGTVQRGQYRCPACGSPSFQITGGREYYVDSVEAE